jgi:hypothetical protein
MNSASAEWQRLAVTLNEFNGATIGYPPIPGAAEHGDHEDADDEHEEPNRHIYVMFSAAHPLTQLERQHRMRGSAGAVGSALNGTYDAMLQQLGLPIYRHAVNPRSCLSLLRAGYGDTHAQADGFQEPGA